jgi:recombination protein RecA
VEQGIVRKSGAWYTYEGDQLGQGKENARNFLRDNPDLANEIEKRIKEKLGVGPRLDADTGAAANANGGNGNANGGNGNGNASGQSAGNGAPPSRAAAAPSRTATTVPGVTV